MNLLRALIAALALHAAAGTSAMEPASPSALRELAPTGKLRVTFALPKGREAALAFVAAFVGEAKASGLVAESIARAGLRGVNAAP
jgi:hypothetical protein